MADNQQAGAKPTADNQRNSPEKSPEAGKGAPEKTYSKSEFDRVDNNRRTLQKELDALQKENDKLKGDMESITAENSALSVALKEQYTDASLKEAVKKLSLDIAGHKKNVAAFEKEKSEFDGIVSKQAEDNLSKMADRLITEFGIPAEKQDELRGFTDPDKMELFAYRNQGEANPSGNTPKPPEQKFEKPTAPVMGGGKDWSDKSPEQKIMSGIARLKNKT